MGRVSICASPAVKLLVTAGRAHSPWLVAFFDTLHPDPAAAPSACESLHLINWLASAQANGSLHLIKWLASVQAKGFDSILNVCKRPASGLLVIFSDQLLFLDSIAVKKGPTA